MVITGASAGIGRATAVRLARDGAALVICARRRAPLEAAADEIRGAGGDVLAVTADVTREAEMDALRRERDRSMGPPSSSRRSSASAAPFFMAAYAATKFAQVGLAESLRAELRGSGIHVTVVYPISTRTNSST